MFYSCILILVNCLLKTGLLFLSYNMVFFFFCTVLSKPIILLHPQNVSVYLGDKPITVIFTCQASGFPPPVIGWVKNDSAVTSGTVVQNGSTSSLVLRLLKGKETPGEYKCIVKNSLGEASSKKGALVIRTQTHGITLGEASSKEGALVIRTQTHGKGLNICTYVQ